MNEHPILFSGDMVRAILEGRKTQTRRIMKVQPANVEWWRSGASSDRFNGVPTMRGADGRSWASCGPFKCPFIPEGLCASFGGKLVNANLEDKTERAARLWVKETFQYTDEVLNVQPGWVYRATDPDWENIYGWKWKPSIFMPRKASRITLEIKSVRVERLKEITMSDVLAEGCVLSTSKTEPLDYQNLWESINGPGSWDKNPWVWVIEFSVLTPRGAEVIAA